MISFTNSKQNDILALVRRPGLVAGVWGAGAVGGEGPGGGTFGKALPLLTRVGCCPALRRKNCNIFFNIIHIVPVKK